MANNGPFYWPHHSPNMLDFSFGELSKIRFTINLNDERGLYGTRANFFSKFEV